MRRRVLHTVASAGDTYGGVASAVAALGAVEAETGHDATLVTLCRPDQGTTVLAELPRWFDVHLVRPGRIAGRVHGGNRLTSALRRLVPQHDLVVIHGVFDLASVVGARTACRFGVPYLLWPHGSLDPYDLVKHQALKYRLAGVWRESLAGAAALMCTTDLEARRLVTFGAPTRRFVLPLPLPAPPRDTAPVVDRLRARTRWRLPSAARVVLYLGRLDEKKGLPLLLSGFAAAAGPDDVLVIAGSGDEGLTARLRADAAALGGRVVFPGWVNGPGRAELLAAADVFALVSDNENFGMAAAEAMAAGVATLISDEVYLADTLRAAGAAVVCDRSVGEVAQALRGLLDDDRSRLRIATAGQTWARQHLAVPSVAARYQDLVAEVMSSCRLSVF